MYYEAISSLKFVVFYQVTKVLLQFSAEVQPPADELSTQSM